MWENRLGLRNTLEVKITLNSSCVKSAKNDTGRGRTLKPRFERPTLSPQAMILAESRFSSVVQDTPITINTRDFHVTYHAIIFSRLKYVPNLNGPVIHVFLGHINVL
ncbi:uncharacterized protein EV154DRAFT_486754 [Mucor mucedo]|uniref:uncharacterized protein n=1 Tax=Mucor mucedo TaxID=29922 RepID=UPI002220BE16|nr:uncharacterized protein EV154DRAFT_486754 [Mucor mucedo]KAI7875370.1 hypothetical protein EV154DRAFT_486754 [Mucor mucedo]